MAFPNYPLDTNRTNLTSAPDRHPLDHNQERAALNDLQAQVDANLAAANAAIATLNAMRDRTCQVRISGGGTQSITDGGSPKLVLFDTDDIDPLGWHSTSTNTDRITPTIPGWYRVSAYCYWTGDTDLIRVRMSILKNGSDFFTDDRPYAPFSGIGPTNSLCPPLIQMNGTTDYITMTAYQLNSSGGANAMFPKLLVEWVRS